jgi:diacylglycerol kinase family enzyme
MWAVNAVSTTAKDTGARALAVVALLCAIAAAVLVALLLVANVGYVVVGLIGVGVVIGAAWGALTTRGGRRILSIVGLAIGIGLVVLAVVGATNGVGRMLIRLAILGALLVATAVSSHAAMRRGIAKQAVGRFRSSPVPSHPVLLCNPWSGGGKVERFGLIELATSMGIETVVLDRGLDLEQLALEAIARGADCLGMAGGDGSQALVASIAITHGLPFVCVSAGTRNHFALDLGFDIDDPRHCLVAFRDGVERRVDFATVNGRLFVNNVSLGVYATIVQQEGYREAKQSTTTNLLPDLLGQADRPFDLAFTTSEGEEVVGAFLVQVSNNPYVLGASLDVSQRRRLDTGSLGVFAVSAASGPEAAAAVTAVMTGHTAHSRQVVQFTASRFQVRSRSGTAFAGVDGEALELPTPLEFKIHPMGLRLLVPKDNLDQAIRRAAREVHIRDLLSLVVHGEPTRHNAPADPVAH